MRTLLAIAGILVFATTSTALFAYVSPGEFLSGGSQNAPIPAEQQATIAPVAVNTAPTSDWQQYVQPATNGSGGGGRGSSYYTSPAIPTAVPSAYPVQQVAVSQPVTRQTAADAVPAMQSSASSIAAAQTTTVARPTQNMAPTEAEQKQLFYGPQNVAQTEQSPRAGQPAQTAVLPSGERETIATLPVNEPAANPLFIAQPGASDGVPPESDPAGTDTALAATVVVLSFDAPGSHRAASAPAAARMLHAGANLTQSGSGIILLVLVALALSITNFIRGHLLPKK